MLLWLLLVHLLVGTPAIGAETWGGDVDDLYRRAHRAPPTRELRLDRAAAAAAAAPETTDLRRLCRLRGVYEGLVLPAVVVAPDQPGVREDWLEYVRSQVLPQGVTHYGLARRGERLAFVFVRRVFTLAGVLDAPAPDTTPRFAGELAPGYTSPQVMVARPDERVERLTVARFGRHAWADIPLDGGPGIYEVELLVEGDRGAEVVALLPLAVGVPAPEAPAIPRRGPSIGAVEDGLPAERRLVALINRDRARLGRSALKTDRSLDRTADKHARAMAAAGMVAHVLPGGRGPADRLARAGVSATLFYENVAMARTIEQAHTELWASPSHRLALLDPELNRIGVAVRAVRGPGGPLLYITEHLARR